MADDPRVPFVADDATLMGGARVRPGDAGYRLLFDRHPQPMWVYDVETQRILAVNDSAIRHYGYTREEFLGMALADLRPEGERQRLESYLRELDEHGHSAAASWRHLLKDGTPIDVEIVSEDLAFGGRRARVVVIHDVTERNRIAAQLDRRTAQQLAVASLGRSALEGAPMSQLMDAAVNLVAESLDLELPELLVPSDDRDSFVLRAGVGWETGLVRTARVPIGSDFQPGFTWGSQGQVRVDDYATESRFRPTPLLRRHGVVSGMSVVLGARRSPCGVLAVYTTEPRAFTEEELGFLHSIAHVLAEAIIRQRADEEIRHQALHDALT